MAPLPPLRVGVQFGTIDDDNPHDAPTTSRSPSTTTSTAPTTTSATTSPTGTDNVVHTVSGEGRAINITYVDNGGVMQTEFNVMLPRSKQVTSRLPRADRPGRDRHASAGRHPQRVDQWRPGPRTDRPRTHDLHRSVLSAGPGHDAEHARTTVR